MTNTAFAQFCRYDGPPSPSVLVGLGGPTYKNERVDVLHALRNHKRGAVMPSGKLVCFGRQVRIAHKLLCG